MNFKKKPLKRDIKATLNLYANLKTLIKTFDLVATDSDTEKQLINLKQLEKMAKNNNNNNNSKKFNNEVEADEYARIPFIKLDNEGDTVEGHFMGFDSVNFRRTPDKGIESVYKLEVEGEVHYLPSNAQLNAKMSKLNKTLEESKSDSIEVQICFTGWAKLDGGNRTKQFRVLTS